MSEPTQPAHQQPSGEPPRRYDPPPYPAANGSSTPAYGSPERRYDPSPDRQGPYQAEQPYASGPTYGAPHRPTNTMAIVSLVSSIVGLTMLPFIGSIVGVVTGHIAKRQIAESGEEGSGIATAGLVIGWIGVAILILIIIALVVFFGIFASAVGSYNPS